MKNNSVKVWQVPVRLVHWLLAATVAAAWYTGEQIGRTHEIIGYVAVALVVARLAWRGNRYARVRNFVRPWHTTWSYLGQVLRGGAARHIGHNPLGGAMAVALWSCVALLGASGWALNTDLLWGYAWPVRIHVTLAWLLVGLIALHLGGVALTSWQHRENLIAAMFSGKKQAPAQNDID